MMIKLRLGMAFCFAVCCVVIGLALESTLAQQQPRLPPDFTFPQEKDSPGKVTFSHESHFAKNPKCTDCHTQIFKMKKGTSGPLTMEAMNEGKACGACHDGQKAFSIKDGPSCSRCHAKE